MLKGLISSVTAGIYHLFSATAQGSEPVDQLMQRVFTLHEGYGQTLSGEAMSPEIAAQIDTYHAVLMVLSQDVGKIPWKAYRRLTPQGREPAADTAVHKVIHERPNEFQSPQIFKEQMTWWAGAHGESFAEIYRDSNGAPRAMYPIHPTRAKLRDDEDGLNLHVYLSSNPFVTNEVPRGGGDYVTKIPYSDVFHLQSTSMAGTGYGFAHHAHQTLGYARATQVFGESFFGKGARPSVIIEWPGQLYEESRKALQSQYQTSYGGARNRGPMVLEYGAKATPIATTPNDSQFLETMQHQVEMVCRFARVSPSKVQHLLRVKFSNVEQLNIDHVTDTMDPWYTRWEEEADEKLFRRGIANKDQCNGFTKFNVSKLLRGDMDARSAWYREMFGIGVMSINDIREAEDLNPIEGGDSHFVQRNMAPLEQMAAIKLDEAGGDNDAGVDNNSARPAGGGSNGNGNGNATAQAVTHLTDSVDAIQRKEERAVNRHIGKYADNRDLFERWLSSRFANEVERDVEQAVERVARGVSDFGVYDQAGTIAADYRQDMVTRALGCYDSGKAYRPQTAQEFAQRILYHG